MPGILLMENAGRGCAELLVRHTPHLSQVAICCGKGNNGGDGFVIARHLNNANIPVELLLFADPGEITGDAALMLHILRHTAVPIHECSGYDDITSHLERAAWVVDALFGTGLNGPVRTPFDSVIAAVNASARPVLAVDIPSGLDCDTGQPLGAAVRATLTATFVAQKVGFAIPAAKPYLGTVHVLDIGAPRTLLARYAPLTPP